MNVIQHAVLDVPFAVSFVVGQATTVRDGLQHAFDADTVAEVARTHEAAHGHWLTLIAAADQDLGPAAADRIAGLYDFHGRVVECLERGAARPLGAAVVHEVHVVLARCLDDLTGHAVAAMERGGAIHQLVAAEHPTPEPSET